MKIMDQMLVTGGAGFIGSHLVRGLLDRGARVRVLDNLSTGSSSRLEQFGGRIEFNQGDLRSYEECLAACRGVKVVFHEAAVPSVPLSVEEPAPSHDSNINGTFNLLRAAVACGVKRFIYAGSSSAYGDAPELPKRENMAPDPKSPYAVQKLAGEHYCRAFFECYGLETVTLRYFNVFGPGQNPKSQYAAAIPAFITAILRGEPPTVYGDGEQSRDFTYIDNVVHGNWLAARMAKASGDVINLACGDQITLNHVIARINAITGRNIAVRYVATRAGDVRHSRADVTRARQLLGFTTQVDFEEGLRRTIEHYRNNG